ncbi:MAG: pyridoxamine 5'-phosphate oxidase family protein [Bacteroidia bacterium]|nr:pyridoxamine 5'-phosphate oxidase family protein [Bacteroidia bacterium]
MTFPDKKIINFINKHHVLTLATASINGPYCANCFYIYLKEKNLFAFTSDKETRHIREISEMNKVAGTVYVDTLIIGKIQGIQFTGVIFEPGDELLARIRAAYIMRFPVALLMDTTFWAVEPYFIKMTDNRFGIGRKLVWEKGKESFFSGKSK